MESMRIGSFLFFTGLIVFLTWFIAKKKFKGRDFSLPVIQIIGLNGAAFIDGLSVMAWELWAILGLILLAIYFLPNFLKTGTTTVSEFFEIRFDRQTRILANAFFLGAYMVILLPVILYVGAIGLIGILNLSFQNEPILLWSIIWSLGFLGSIFAFYPWQKFNLIFGQINGISLIFGGLLITIIGLLMAGDGKGIYEGFLLLQIYAPEKFNSIGDANQSVPFGSLFSGVLLLNLFSWCTHPQILSRNIPVKDLGEEQKEIIFAAGLKLLGPLFLVLPGIIAFHLIKNKGILPDKAFGMLVNNILPPYLGGLFAAILMGAVLSYYGFSLISALGFYKNILAYSPLSRHQKIIGSLLALIPMAIAPLLANQRSIFLYLQKMNGIFLIPIFAVMVIGMNFRQVPPFAAKLALFLGGLFISFGYFIPIKGTNFITDFINEFHFLGLVFVCLLVTMLFIGKINPLKRLFFQENIKLRNWKYTFLLSAILIFLVFWIYYSFSEFSIRKYQLELASVFLVVIFLLIFRVIKFLYQKTYP